MSDAAQNSDQTKDTGVVDNTTTETTKISYEELETKYNTLETRFNSVLSKHDELMTEAKNAKREKARIEQEQAEESSRLAEKNGEFEKLWKTASQEKEQLMQQLKDMKNVNRQERLNNSAMEAATQLADGYNAEILKDIIIKNLANLADDDGSVTSDVLESVVSEFKNNEKFKSLLRGSKASGGGAPGNMRGAQQSNEMTKSDFNQLSAAEQHAFLIDKGGKVVNG